MSLDSWVLFFALLITFAQTIDLSTVVQVKYILYRHKINQFHNNKEFYDFVKQDVLPTSFPDDGSDTVTVK